MDQLKNSMKVTRKEVAIKAGVSTATVSNVFNGSNKVKKTTAELVRKVAEQLDYKPDMIARSMRTNRTMQMGPGCGGSFKPVLRRNHSGI